MYWLRVDLDEREHRLHREDCPHIIPEETKTMGLSKLKTNGGWIRFDSVGEAMKYIKENQIPGLVDMCSFCKPLDDLRAEPLAKLQVKGVDSETNPKPKEYPVTDTKSIWKRLSKKLLGKK
jgi:hypothetical protein